MARIPLMTQANGMPAVPTWKPSTAYKAGQLVSFGTDLYLAKVDFTSGASFSATNWNLVGSGTYVTFAAAAKEPDLLISGAITRDTNGAATSAPVVWPDGSTGTYTATTVSAAFPGSVDAYTVTKVTGGVTTTYTQAAVTRNAVGAVTVRPAIAVA